MNQQTSRLAQLPLGPGTIMVFVHAHPDDETLWTGGLIATAAQAGARVIVVTCTRGERGEVLTLPGTASEHEGCRQGNGAALAEFRVGELNRALAALAEGASTKIEHHFLDELPPSQGSVASRPTLDASPRPPANGDSGPGPDAKRQPARYEDSGMVWLVPGIAGPDPALTNGFAQVPTDEAAGRLANLLTEVQQARPTNNIIVVTYEKGGGYGHPDHTKAREVAARAIELSQEKAHKAYAVELDEAWAQGALACAAKPLQSVPPKPVALWEAIVPATDYERAINALRLCPEVQTLASADGLSLPPAPSETPPPMVLPPGENPDIEVPIAPVLPHLLAAMRAYATQIQAAQELPEVAAEGVLGAFALSNGVLTPIRAKETYRTAAL